MPIINEAHTINGDEVSISLIVWRRFRLPAPGMVEAVLNANPGLADQGQFIPRATDVIIPIDTDLDLNAAAPIKLWDEV